MATDPQILINGHFDGLLSEEQFSELNAWIAGDPEHAKVFARAALLHDRLRNHCLAKAELVRDENRSAPASELAQRRVHLRWKCVAFLMSAAAGILFVFVFWQGFRGDTARAAEAELKRLIQVTDRVSDRSYLITALDEGDQEKPRDVDIPKNGGRVQPPIDGAILYTRGPGQFVLIRKYEDGTEFITGSNGKTSWACPPVKEGKKGQVRVSNDPLRFRGPVPGQQHNIPFLDIRTNLDQLCETYDLTFLAVKPSADGGEKWKGIRAERLEQATGGPKRVEIWYMPETGVIQQMWFDGMPRARGGPRSLLVELIDQRNRGPNFFDHTAHHEPDRRIVDADQDK